MNDELGYVLDNYKEVIAKHIGSKIGVSFFADSESYVDKIEPVKTPMTPYKISDGSEINVVFFQDFSVGKDTMLTDCNICTIDKFTFLKIITPFTRDRSYDFIVTKAEETENVLKALNERKGKEENVVIDFPVVGLDFTDLKKQTIDFLLNEEFRKFCHSKHIKLKRGIVFEGHPGNGKSLSLRWLKAEAQKADIEFKQFGDPKEFLDDQREYYDKSKKHIFVFEDFDTILRERDDTGDAPNVVLGKVLNTLDGIDEIEDVVSIFTTNKIDLFDSAFIRPGRIDKVISFPDPTADEMGTFLNDYIAEYAQFFPAIIKKLTAKNQNVSFAIMKGICDDINIYQFNEGTLSEEAVLKIVDEKLYGANKGKESKENSHYML